MRDGEVFGEMALILDQKEVLQLSQTNPLN